MFVVILHPLFMGTHSFHSSEPVLPPFLHLRPHLLFIEEQAIVLSAFYIFQPFLKSHQFFFLKIRISGPLKTCISGPQPFGFSSHKLTRNSKGLSLS